MSHYIRPKIPGATIFFTLTLAERGSDLLVRNVDLLREAFHRTLLERPFFVDAIVVLPDHLHALITLPATDSDYATRWRIIKTRFSRSLPCGALRESHIARNERGIWQRRFWEHHIREEDDFRAHVEYCWNNPVKHGFVAKAADWPFSSIHRDLAQGMVSSGWA